MSFGFVDFLLLILYCPFPGDEIVLLMSQYLQYKASGESTTFSERHLIAAAGLLEEAIENSPYNPHLKIAAIGVYSRLNGVHRAYEHYLDMGVRRNIQLDSCIYLILPVLIRGGLYTQAIQLSSSLLKFHGSTSKDMLLNASDLIGVKQKNENRLGAEKGSCGCDEDVVPPNSSSEMQMVTSMPPQ